MLTGENVPAPCRIFLLSPARTSGKRASLIYNPDASFEIAVQVRDGGAPIGEVFAFLSGLYFRGKLAYAKRFAKSADEGSGVWIITSNRGIVPPETVVSTKDLLSFKEIDINPSEKLYVETLTSTTKALADALPSGAEVVLLGSISSDKYVEILIGIFGERLKFPADFLGRGDMSRGGLMLRCVDSGKELEYIPLIGAIRRGKRPPRLEPLSRKNKS